MKMVGVFVEIVVTVSSAAKASSIPAPRATRTNSACDPGVRLGSQVLFWCPVEDKFHDRATFAQRQVPTRHDRGGAQRGERLVLVGGRHRARHGCKPPSHRRPVALPASTKRERTGSTRGDAVSTCQSLCTSANAQECVGLGPIYRIKLSSDASLPCERDVPSRVGDRVKAKR